MEGHARRRLQVLITIAALGASSVPAHAAGDGYEPSPVDVEVGTDPGGINVDAGTGATDPGSPGSATDGSSGGAQCYLRAVPESAWDQDIELGYWARHMQYSPYYLICDGQIKAIEWIEITDPPPPGPGPGRDPREIAMELRERIPIPQVDVEMNPGRGLVGVDSWFWLDGYGGAPIRRSTDAFGELVEVEARVRHYRWAFGDGAEFTSDGPGAAYPHRSEIRHNYQRSSAGRSHGYTVEVAFVFEVRYRVSGGSWLILPGISRDSTSDYVVRESQAVIER